MILISFENLDLITTITAPLSCLGNIGTGFGEIIGPVGNFSSFLGFLKSIFCFNMLEGRLELFPIIMFFYSFKECITISRKKFK